MTFSYTSGFSGDIMEMMCWRTTLGYKERSYRYLLRHFDAFCAENYPDENVLTWNIALAFLNEARKRRDVRCDVIALRNLAKYQLMEGKDACMFPSDFFSYQKRKLPYIMNREDCRRFFDATDHFPSNPKNPLMEYVVPVLFRLQYATGMRPWEVRNLSRLDFDFVHDTIYIPDTKRHKDRQIAVDHKLMQMCKNYDNIACSICPDASCFFPDVTSQPYTAAKIQTLFHKCWENAKNPEGLSYCTPYILRHNFATHTLIRWMEEGKDLDAYIPYLSAYMGHTTFRDTYYYIHLLPEKLSKMACLRIREILMEAEHEI